MNDTIYRSDAIALANGGCHPANIAEELAKLPSAQPEVAKDTNVPINDCISRQAAIDLMLAALDDDWEPEYARDRMMELPTAHRSVAEWCVDCKEYDTERKCCPRFNRVIRTAVDDSNTYNTLNALEALERILNYCEEIDLHLPEAERSGYKMLPDYEAVRSALTGSVTGWIPVTEQLPDEDSKVIITDEDGDIYIARYEYNPWTDDPIVEWWSDEYRVYPVAWMPLPEPYREDGGTE